MVWELANTWQGAALRWTHFKKFDELNFPETD